MLGSYPEGITNGSGEQEIIQAQDSQCLEVGLGRVQRNSDMIFG